MARNRTLVRTLRLWREMQGQRYAPRLSQLAERHGVCERTIRRDLEALEEANIPVPAWRWFGDAK